MYDKVFKRIEKKYVLDEKQLKKLFFKIKPYIMKDKYYQSTINNIYFDTNSNDLIINSIDKPLFKEKIRVRSYGIPNEYDNVFLEIKTKNNGVVGKRRIAISLNEFNDFLENHNYDKNNQIMKEIVYHFEYYKLVPKRFIAYDRKSFVGINNKNLRITVDANLRSREDNLCFEAGSSGCKYFDKPHYIVEIKTPNSIPLWLAKILSELKIYPMSFSKYGSIYKKKGDVLC